MTNVEIQMTKEGRNFNDEKRCAGCFRHSSFVIHSTFEFRHSSFIRHLVFVIRHSL